MGCGSANPSASAPRCDEFNVNVSAGADADAAKVRDCMDRATGSASKLGGGCVSDSVAAVTAAEVVGDDRAACRAAMVARV